MASPSHDPVALPECLRERYEVGELLGAGAMGSVHAARDRELDRDVAIKLTRFPERREAELQARFEREARALSSLKHPNLMEIYDFGIEEGVGYLVTERLRGPSFRDLPPEVDPGEGWRQVGQALEVVHAAGLVHRDVKPDNAILTEGGRAVLIDFGLALGGETERLTRTGAVVGTPAYMAPEVLAGSQYSPASDWFSWAVSLYELREGKVPYESLQLVGAHAAGHLASPRFERLEQRGPEAGAVTAILRARPGDRPPSWKTIEKLLEGKGAQLATTVALPRPRMRRTPVLLGLAALLAAGLGWFLLRSSTGSPPAAPSSAASPEDWEEMTRLRRSLKVFAPGPPPADPTRLIVERSARFADPRFPVRLGRFLRNLRDLLRRLRSVSGSWRDGRLPDWLVDFLHRELLPTLSGTIAEYSQASARGVDWSDTFEELSPPELKRLQEHLDLRQARIDELVGIVSELPPWPAPEDDALGEVQLIFEIYSSLEERNKEMIPFVPRLEAILREPRSRLPEAWRIHPSILVLARLVYLPEPQCGPALRLHEVFGPRFLGPWSDDPGLLAGADLSILWAYSILPAHCRRDGAEYFRKEIDGLAERVLGRLERDPLHVAVAAERLSKYQLSLMLLDTHGQPEVPAGLRRIIRSGPGAIRALERE